MDNFSKEMFASWHPNNEQALVRPVDFSNLLCISNIKKVFEKYNCLGPIPRNSDF